jgi:hypothetical protein
MTYTSDQALPDYVRERAIAFTAREVSATISESMRQFRRVVKVQPPTETPHFRDVVGSYSGAVRPLFLWGRFASHKDWERFISDPRHDPDVAEDILWPGGDSDGFTCNRFDAGSGMRCPFGAAANPFRELGDRLWVKETWAAPHAFDHLPPRLIPRDARIHYASTEERGGLLWRSPVSMPRWASRLVLEIINVDLQRPQNVSDLDLRREGFGEAGRSDLHAEWDRRYGAGSWASMPWSWVIRYKIALDMA